MTEFKSDSKASVLSSNSVLLASGRRIRAVGRKPDVELWVIRGREGGSLRKTEA